MGKRKNNFYAIKLIVTTWDECRDLAKGKPEARYKGFVSKEEAKAWVDGTRFVAKGAPIGDFITVDGWCKDNPGPCGFVVTYKGKVIHKEDLGLGTNNIAEFIGLAWALFKADQLGVPCYCDSTTAMLAWDKKRLKTSFDVESNPKLVKRFKAIEKNIGVIKSIPHKWNTGLWGEIPADPGNK